MPDRFDLACACEHGTHSVWNCSSETKIRRFYQTEQEPLNHLNCSLFSIDGIVKSHFGKWKHFCPLSAIINIQSKITQRSNAQSLVLTAHPQIKAVSVIHTTMLLDRNVIKCFHHSSNAKIIISLLLCNNMYSGGGGGGAPLVRQMLSESVCWVVKWGRIDPLHPLINGWPRAAQRLRLPQRLWPKWEHDYLTPHACRRESSHHHEMMRVVFLGGRPLQVWSSSVLIWIRSLVIQTTTS